MAGSLQRGTRISRRSKPHERDTGARQRAPRAQPAVRGRTICRRSSIACAATARSCRSTPRTHLRTPAAASSKQQAAARKLGTRAFTRPAQLPPRVCAARDSATASVPAPDAAATVLLRQLHRGACRPSLLRKLALAPVRCPPALTPHDPRSLAACSQSETSGAHRRRCCR